MTFVVKYRRGGSLIACEYLCPVHGRFELDVHRDDNGDPPAMVVCARSGDDELSSELCDLEAEWVISAPLGRVKLVEAVRGKWQKPERKTWLDTRELGEGMDPIEWREKRAAIRDEQRRKEIKDL